MAHITGKFAAIFRMKEEIGQPTILVTQPIGTGDGANKTFVLGHPISVCDALPGWSGTALALDAGDKKEGINSIQDTIPAAPGTYETKFTPGAALDLTHHRYVSIWLKNTVASAGMVTARIRLYTGANYNYYNITFAAAAWVRLDIAIRAPDGNSGTAPDFASIDAISVALDAGGAAYVLHVDWLTRNPVAAEVAPFAITGVVGQTIIEIYDGGTLVPYEDVSVSPSGIVVFDTAPINLNDITSSYGYYEEIEQIGGAFDWEANMTVDTPEVTDFQSTSGAKEFIVGNEGWTGSSNRHYELSDEMTSGKEYIVRMYLYLDKDLPEYYEGWAKLNRISKTVPQEEIVDESLEFQGNGRFFKVFQT